MIRGASHQELSDNALTRFCLSLAKQNSAVFHKIPVDSLPQSLDVIYHDPYGEDPDAKDKIDQELGWCCAEFNKNKQTFILLRPSLHTTVTNSPHILTLPVFSTFLEYIRNGNISPNTRYNHVVIPLAVWHPNLLSYVFGQTFEKRHWVVAIYSVKQDQLCLYDSKTSFAAWFSSLMNSNQLPPHLQNICIQPINYESQGMFNFTDCGYFVEYCLEHIISNPHCLDLQPQELGKELEKLFCKLEQDLYNHPLAQTPLFTLQSTNDPKMNSWELSDSLFLNDELDNQTAISEKTEQLLKS